MKNSKLTQNVALYYLYMLFSDAVLIGAVLIPFFSTWAGLPQSQIQILQSINMISILLLEIPTGVIADRFGRKASLITGTVFSILGIFMMTIVPSFSLFIIAELLLAFGAACKSGADTALIYDSLKQSGHEENAKLVMTKADSLRLIGVVLGSIVGGLIAPYVQSNIVWRLSVIPFIVALCISFFFVEPKSEQPSENKKWIKIFTDGVRSLFGNRVLLFYSLDMILTATFSYFVIWFYQPKLSSMGISDKYFGIIHAFVILSSVSVLYTAGFWLKKFGIYKFAILTSLLTALGFLIGGLSNSIIAFVLLIIFSAGFGGARSMIFVANFNKLIESKERATVNSSISMLRNLVISFANPIFGTLADVNLNRCFLILGVLTLLATGFSFWVQTNFKLKEESN